MKKHLCLFLLIILITTNLFSQDFQLNLDRGDSCLEQRELPAAILFYKQALESKPERIIIEQNEVIVFSKLAFVYNKIAEYQKSIEYYFKYLDKDIIKENDSLLTTTYNAIGVNYDFLKQDDLALKFYKKSIEASNGNSIRIAIVYNNLAYIYWKKSEPKMAKEYYKKSLAIFEEQNYYFGIISTQMNLGVMEFESNNLEVAYKLLDKAWELAVQQNDTLSEIMISINLGDYYSKKLDYDNAEKHLEWALKTAIQKNVRESILESYNSFVNLYKAKGEYEKALEYMGLFKACNDSISNANQNREYAELETKYSIKEKEKELLVANNEQQLSESRINEQSRYIWFLSIIVAFSLLLIILIYIQYIKRKKSKNELLLKNAEILKSKKLLEDLNFQYEKLIEKYETQ